MPYLTLEAEIDNGRVVPCEPDKLPRSGRALVTVLTQSQKKPNWDVVEHLLGRMETKVDGIAIERDAREEWNRP